MGQLVTLDQLNQGLGWTWYFKLAEFENKRPKLPCSAFPYSLAINNTVIAEQHVCTYELKNRIRNWVAESCADTVILDILKKDYYYNWGSSYSGGYNVFWGYHVFYFQTSEEHLMFKLAFSEYISDILPYDPEKPPNYITSAKEDLLKSQENLDSAYEAYKKSTKKKDRAELGELLVNFDTHLRRWDGESDLIFKDDDGKEVERPELLRVYRRIRDLKRSERLHEEIMDIHSTFIPKARF
jgi:hypothetical protein